MDAHHHARVTVLADAPCHDSHEGILETMYMNNVLTLAQQSREAHRAVDIGHPLEREDRNRNLKPAVLREDNWVLTANHLDVEIRIISQPFNQVIGILLSACPVLIGNYVENVNHLSEFCLTG